MAGAKIGRSNPDVSPSGYKIFLSITIRGKRTMGQNKRSGQDKLMYHLGNEIHGKLDFNGSMLKNGPRFYFQCRVVKFPVNSGLLATSWPGKPR